MRLSMIDLIQNDHDNRPLSQDEITQLKQQGCMASDWKKIYASPNFSCAAYKDVIFKGLCRLGGTTDKTRQPCIDYGVIRTTLEDVYLDDDVMITDTSLIFNYKIESNVFIRLVSSMEYLSDLTEGVGVRANILNEDGRNYVALYPGLTAQIAELYVHYAPNDPEVANALEKLCEDEKEERLKRSYGIVESGAGLWNIGLIRTVHIGASAKLHGTRKLINGTILSSDSNITVVGDNVNAKDFIIDYGVEIDNNVYLNRCFVGGGCTIRNGFSASDSLFFANCHLEKGESCASFLGPHSISMHKNTLMIGLYGSFLNLGSGANQSNHLYKQGPIHHGEVGRGVKFASDAYIAWPAKIAPFTLIMGRHYAHPNTSEYPFSYLIAKDNRSYLYPAVTLKTCGITRDIAKWPKRDKRPKEAGLVFDIINYNWLNPTYISLILKAKEKLKKMLEKMPMYQAEFYDDDSLCWIKRSSMEEAIHLYDLTLSKYFGDLLSNYKSNTDKIANSNNTDKKAHWIDICGLFATIGDLERIILTPLRKGAFVCIDQLSEAFVSLHQAYPVSSRSFFCQESNREFGHIVEDENLEEFKAIIQKNKSATEELQALQEADRIKENELIAHYSFDLNKNQ